LGYISADEQILLKIRKYAGKLNEAFSHIESANDQEIDDGMYGLVVAQCLTNLNSLALRIENDDISDKLAILTSKRTAVTRNIAAHDYDAINWGIVKSNCRLILNTINEGLIGECLNICAEMKKLTKDYT